MTEKLHIIKIGGNVIDSPKALDRFLSDFAALKGKKILVHGGGKIATELGKKLGIETKMVEGRRITDAETIDLVTMTYAGLINKKIVAALQAKNCNAIGFSGADGNLIRANKRPVTTIDYGFVGDIADGSVNTTLVSSLLGQDVMPVVCPITHDGKGNLLNTNADTIAASLAVAMAGKYETRLFYCFEKNGVLRDINDDTSFIPELKQNHYEEMKEKKQIYEGMIPKLDNAFQTVSKGVHSVYICNAFHLSSIVNNANPLEQESVELLKQLIATPSLSKEEEGTAGIIQDFFSAKNIPSHRKKNNVWAFNKHFDKSKPTILLNSHHDTVKPNPGYTRNPFIPAEEEGKLFGLGSNDAGASLVALIFSFIHFYEHTDLTHNLLFAATAEEEISGKNGISKILPELPEIDFAIVGEPTSLQMAIAEKGLMVVDCIATGKAGHAAREEGENALYKALQDIEWLRTYQFPKISETLGPVKMTVTIIRSGSQHNVIPASCEFTIDIRTTDAYSNEEVLEIIQQHISSQAKARSTRLKPSSIGKDHILIKAAKELGIKTYGSPTLSDQALISAPSVKIGPGDSARSHTANEYISIAELKEGIELYVKILTKIII